MRKLLLFFIGLLVAATSTAQYHFSFSHYTSDNGLSQNSITAMMKDRKGYLWIGTRDGLNKFDGYNFTNYSSKSHSDLSVFSNRILDLKEDKWGFIWVKTYDEIVYRLNPATEEMMRIKAPNGNFINDKINKIYLLASGAIWLATYNQGCYEIITNPDNNEITTKLYDKKNRLIPNNTVSDIFEDQEKNTWLLTLGGLCLFDQNSKKIDYFDNQPFFSFTENNKRILFGGKGKVVQYEKRNRAFKTINLGSTTPVTNISTINSNMYIVGTQGDGFFALDILHDKLQQFSLAKYPEMKTNIIEQIYIDRAGDAWLSIKSSGIIHYNPQTNKLDYIPSKVNAGQITNPNFLIFEDEKDMLWIQPYFGSFSWYDRATNSLVPFYSAYNEDINTLFSYGVNHVLSDSQGVFWISTNRGNGFFKCTFLPDYFNHYLFEDHSVYSIANETRAIFEDSKRRLWVACKDGTVHVFDENKRSIGTLSSNGKIQQGNKLDVSVYNFFEDKTGNIWLATKRQGLYRLRPNGNNSFKMENFKHDDNDPFSPINNDFYSVDQDKKGRIWAGSYGGGLHLLDERSGKPRFYHAKNILTKYPNSNCSKVRQVYVDSKQTVWVATTEGLVYFDGNTDNPKDIKFHYYHKIKNTAGSLGANDVHCILEDMEKNIWVGTFGGGLNRLKTKNLNQPNLEFEVFDRANNIPNNVV